MEYLEADDAMSVDQSQEVMKKYIFVELLLNSSGLL